MSQAWDPKDPVVELRNVNVIHKSRTGGLFHPDTVHAVNDVSLTISRGQTLGIVGESGCGKSTTARTALNPRMIVHDTLIDPLNVHGIGSPKDREARVRELLELVGLPLSALDVLPRQISGGQRQRVAIARALALDPDIIVADEPTSALDVSVRAQVLNLLQDLKASLGLGLVFISHDINTVRYVSDRIAVMYYGKIIEENTTQEIFAHPKDAYTRKLLSAVPSLLNDAGPKASPAA